MNCDGISVIFITHNRKTDLEYTLGQLKKQICNFPWEIIIVDQNSNDSTESLFTKEDNQIKYIRLDKNIGVAGGRNVGVSLAKYEYLVFMDDDAHFVENNALNQIYQLMKENSEIDMFAFQIRNLENGLYNWPYGKKRISKCDSTFFTKFFIGCGHAIKKSFFDNVGGYSNILFFWGEETELVLKSFSRDKSPVLYYGRVKIIHRVEGNGRNSDPGRFYYQVRNRMFLIKTYFPKSVKGMVMLYYKLGYFFKAYHNKWIPEYKKGIRDFENMKIHRANTVTIKKIIKYWFL
jgi:GT2 family glycosyltransferase